MDAIIALDTAGLILDATRYILEIISASPVTANRSRHNEEIHLGTVTRLKLALAENQILLKSDPSHSSGSLPLQEISTSRDACIALLDNTESIIRRASDDTLGETDTRGSQWRQRDDTYHERKIDRLNTTVTRQVIGILKYVVRRPCHDTV